MTEILIDTRRRSPTSASHHGVRIQGENGRSAGSRLVSQRIRPRSPTSRPASRQAEQFSRQAIARIRLPPRQCPRSRSAPAHRPPEGRAARGVRRGGSAAV